MNGESDSNKPQEMKSEVRDESLVVGTWESPSLIALPSNQRPVHKRQFDDDANPRFSIFDLMVITGVVAATIMLVSKFGIGGALFMFAVSCTATMVLRRNVKIASRYRLWNQFIWGIAMPVGCIFNDPFVFGSFDQGQLQQVQELGIACYALIGWEILFLVFSWFVTPKHRMLNSLLAGTFFAGALFSLLVALMLVPLTLIGIFMLIGVLGLTPWFTGLVFWNAGMMHWRRAGKQKTGAMVGWVTSGFLLTLTVFASALLFSHAMVAGLNADMNW